MTEENQTDKSKLFWAIVCFILGTILVLPTVIALAPLLIAVLPFLVIIWVIYSFITKGKWN
jgi:hypothetical protein